MAAVTQGPLKDFLGTRKNQTKVISRVDRYLQTRRPDTSRRTDVLHPSEIVGKDWCLRASYHLLRGAEPKRVSHPLRLENVFRTGHDIHEKWQGWLGDAGYLYGYWRCRACGSLTVAMYQGAPEHSCITCGLHMWQYAEVPVYIDSLRIQGHTDGWLVFPDDEDHLLEIKSIGVGTIRHYESGLLSYGSLEEMFKQISRPFYGHNLQVQVYFEALHREYGDEAPQKAIILYENKSNQDVKEFVIERNPALIDNILDRAYEVVEAANVGSEPKCSIKPGSTCSKCKEFAV